MTNVSPLRYPGGKTRACKILDKIIDERGIDLTTYDFLISPFFGGGSFEFFLQNKHPNLCVLANDKYLPLYNFWQTVKDDPVKKSALCSYLEPCLGTLDLVDFKTRRAAIINEFEETVEQAAHYFIINRSSFSGATLSGGFSIESAKTRFTQSSIDRVKHLNLGNFQFFNLNFDKFLITACLIPKDNKYFVFVDPPYYLEKGSKLYGTSGDLHENFDHDTLFEILHSYTEIGIKWMLTYNDCPYIRELYDGTPSINILDVDWKYGMNKTKKSSEIVIINF